LTISYSQVIKSTSSYEKQYSHQKVSLLMGKEWLQKKKKWYKKKIPEVLHVP
jgi:hypothetical protein